MSRYPITKDCIDATDAHTIGAAMAVSMLQRLRTVDLSKDIPNSWNNLLAAQRHIGQKNGKWMNRSLWQWKGSTVQETWQSTKTVFCFLVCRSGGFRDSGVSIRQYSYRYFVQNTGIPSAAWPGTQVSFCRTNVKTCNGDLPAIRLICLVYLLIRHYNKSIAFRGILLNEDASDLQFSWSIEFSFSMDRWCSINVQPHNATKSFDCPY